MEPKIWFYFILFYFFIYLIEQNNTGFKPQRKDESVKTAAARNSKNFRRHNKESTYVRIIKRDNLQRKGGRTKSGNLKDKKENRHNRLAIFKFFHMTAVNSISRALEV